MEIHDIQNFNKTNTNNIYEVFVKILNIMYLHASPVHIIDILMFVYIEKADVGVLKKTCYSRCCMHFLMTRYVSRV